MYAPCFPQDRGVSKKGTGSMPGCAPHRGQGSSRRGHDPAERLHLLSKSCQETGSAGSGRAGQEAPGQGGRSPGRARTRSPAPCGAQLLDEEGGQLGTGGPESALIPSPGPHASCPVPS